MWLTLLRAGWPYGLAFAGGLIVAGGLQQLRIESVRADLLILQARVALANEGARLAQQKAASDTADAQRKIDAIAAELSKALAGSPRTVDVVRTIRVRGVCRAPDSQDNRAPKNQNPPVSAGDANPESAPAASRCFRPSDYAEWNDSLAAQRQRLIDREKASQAELTALRTQHEQCLALRGMIESAQDHIEITD